MSLLNQQNNKGKKKGNKKSSLANSQGSKFIQNLKPRVCEQTELIPARKEEAEWLGFQAL